MKDTTHAIRVMIVDDSAVARGVIRRLLDAESGIEVVATAADGALALRTLDKQAVDVVLLDIEMPVMDGLATLRRIVADHPGVKVIMVSTLTRRNAQISLEALEIGAADYVTKPEAGIATAREFARDLVSRIRGLAVSPKLATRQPPTAPRSAPPYPVIRRGKIRVVAIGASTGGPPALLKLFRSLQGSLVGLPILVTQHMPATFTALLAEQIERSAGRPCAEARDGEAVLPGRVYVAPGGWHMTVENGPTSPIIRLNQEAAEHFCRPAVDPMLRSVATVYGEGALAVVLTGMGSDGALGCEAISRAKGRFITQDQATSTVWGMPAAAAATGLAEAVLPLDDVGPWLRRTVESAL